MLTRPQCVKTNKRIPRIAPVRGVSYMSIVEKMTVSISLSRAKTRRYRPNTFVIILFLICVRRIKNGTPYSSAATLTEVYLPIPLSALLALCEGNPSVLLDSLQNGPVMRTSGVLSVVSLNKLLDKQSIGCWTNSWSAVDFGTPRRSCDVILIIYPTMFNQYNLSCNERYHYGSQELPLSDERNHLVRMTFYLVQTTFG